MTTLNFLDLFIIAVLVLSILMFLTGNGDLMIRLFGGNGGGPQEDIYDKAKMHRASLIFCVVLLLMEILQLVLKDRYPMISLLSVGITIAALACYVFYLKKYAKK